MQSPVLSTVELFVRPSVTRWHRVKTMQARITKSSPTDSPRTLVLAIKIHPEIRKGSPRARELNESGLTLDLVLPRATGAHRAVQLLHSERSLAKSRASSHVTSSNSRSLFTVEVHVTLGRPLLLLRSDGVQSITCRGSLLESIRYT